MRQHGARQGLVDREVQDLVQILAPEFAQVLPHAIEDDDRVIERVTDHRQHRAHDDEAHLEVEVPNEGDGRQDVVERREHGGQAETPLEPDGEIGQGDEEREEDRQERFPLELFPHLRADGLGAEDGVMLGAGSQTTR